MGSGRSGARSWICAPARSRSASWSCSVRRPTICSSCRARRRGRWCARSRGSPRSVWSACGKSRAAIFPSPPRPSPRRWPQRSKTPCTRLSRRASPWRRSRNQRPSTPKPRGLSCTPRCTPTPTAAMAPFPARPRASSRSTAPCRRWTSFTRRSWSWKVGRWSRGSWGKLRRLPLHPIPRLEELLVEPCLGRARLGVPVVAPADERGEGHEDRLGPAAGLEPEKSAAVPDEVELHVAATAIELEVAFALAVRNVPATPQDWKVGREEVVAHAPQEFEGPLEAPFVQVVEEDPADAARLTAVFQVEVLVTPLLVARVNLRAKRLARRAGGAMPVDRVFLEAIVGRQVEPATEPPDRLRVRLLRKKEADVHVGRGHVGVVLIEDEGDTESLEASARQLGPLRGSGRRQPRAMDMGEAHPGLLEHRPLAQHPRLPAATLRPLPGILVETSGAVLRFDGGADAVLETEEVGLDGGKVGAIGHRRS